MGNVVSGMDRRTGKVLAGWPYVLQCAEYVLATAFFSIPMRPQVGSNAHRLLGQLANARTIQRFRWAVALALKLHVPNFDPTDINLVDLDRTGAASWVIDGIYYPRGHLGDFSDGQRRSLVLAADRATLSTLVA